LSLCIALTSTLGAISHAQSDGADFEAPIIERDDKVPSVQDDAEVFMATVVDNIAIQSVTLYYRFSAEEEFKELPMRPLAGTSSFSATVEPAFGGGGAVEIEYYISAEDSNGNLALDGDAEVPHVRMHSDDTSNVIENDIVLDQDSREEIKLGKKVNWLYVGLGVLLVGGVAAAASGGGGGSSGGGGKCTDECTVTVTFPVP